MDYKARSNRLIARVVSIADLCFLVITMVVLGSSLYFPKVYAELNKGWELKHLFSMLAYLWVRQEVRAWGRSATPVEKPASAGEA